jgi:hypothetical protein
MVKFAPSFIALGELALQPVRKIVRVGAANAFLMPIVSASVELGLD